MCSGVHDMVRKLTMNFSTAFYQQEKALKMKEYILKCNYDHAFRLVIKRVNSGLIMLDIKLDHG